MKKSDLFFSYQLETLEKKYNAIFVADLPLPTKLGSWSTFPAAIFYQENPDTQKGHSHYFAIYRDLLTDELMITNAERSAAQKISAVVANNGEVIYSKARHDFRGSKDGSVFIDGGFEYIRTNSTNFLDLFVVADKLMYSKPPLAVIREVTYDDEGLMYL